MPKHKMTVDEFLIWSQKQPERPRFELINGTPIAMSPERVRHNLCKAETYGALRDAIKKTGSDCTAFGDGMTVVIDEHTSYEPDALVSCDETISGDDVTIANPVIIVEVLSPGTRSVDVGAKLVGYFQLASVHHYLIIDPEKKIVTHHQRHTDRDILTRILQEGSISMVPPGLEIELADLFAGPID